MPKVGVHNGREKKYYHALIAKILGYIVVNTITILIIPHLAM